MMNKKPYQPVSCATHSEYELAIMHRQTLQLHWLDESGHDCIEEVIPTDIMTRENAEYLVVKTGDGELKEIRLDKITGTE